MNVGRLLHRAEDVLATVLDLFARPATPSQAALARQFCDDLDLLMRGQSNGEGSDFWQSVCRDLQRFAATDDPMQFMRWQPIRATMVHGASPVTFRMWWMLRRDAAWRSRWAPALRHPQYGGPPPFAPMLSTNAMAIEHASHLFRFHRQNAAYLHEAECIVEFGGGFGSMCRVSRALGFRGRYIIFDLPPVLALQRFYLGLHGIAADSAGDGDVWLCSDLDALMGWLTRTSPRQVSLMSTWALSEMPMAVRQRIEPFFSLPIATKALLAYQPNFEGTDNHAYFSGLMDSTAGQWSWTQLPVDPASSEMTQDESRYVFGVVR
jgi:hypothetical protein